MKSIHGISDTLHLHLARLPSQYYSESLNAELIFVVFTSIVALQSPLIAEHLKGHYPVYTMELSNGR